MGISRDSTHKRRATGGKVKPWRKKRKFELGRPAAMTKIGSKRIHLVKARGSCLKHRALRLDSGNYSWGTEHVTRKTRILRVVYNSTNNELVRTNTLVKNAIVVIDGTPFRQWYEQHYGVQLGKKKKAKEDKKSEGAEPASTTPAAPATEVKKSKAVQRKLKLRQKTRTLESALEEQFLTGNLYACISSRPGQSGRADGYILEGKELDFYLKRIRKKK
eukprot:TRINITY_DN5034_c0_g1_i1.p1 TRINITY_DN5034_c0_g1~~TRINITY_DN5034_c0_g1_i1.p1  ORF type:complete len:218 (-),score=52.06 TRINITY_DN5034_c0_g1_i1:129-782(-)